ncbi:MAG: DNRLRE domain-containing protein [Candidatus Woesearchaeota archaeon]
MNLRGLLKIVFIFLAFIFLINIVNAAAPNLDAILTPQNLTENVAFNLTIIASDPESGPLNFSDDTNNFDITKINDTNAEILFTPSNSMIGSFIAVIIVIDNESLVDAQAVEFIVNGIPSLTNLADQNVTAGNQFYYDINATDPENGTNVTFGDNSTLFNINTSTGEINFTTDNSMIGIYSISISVNDSLGANTSGTFNLAINDQPNITSLPGNVTLEDQSFEINISDLVTDTVGTLTFFDNSTFFDINSSTGLINFTPGQNETGNHTINITVTDNYGLNDSKIWSLNITPVNDAPSFTNISNETIAVGLQFTLQINATDEENDTITYYDNSTFFTINQTTGLINFTVNNSMVGTHIINITANDTSSAAYSDTFKLIINTNAAPIFGKNFTININPNIDTYVDSEFPDTDYRGNEYLQISGGDTTRRIYLNFSTATLPTSTSFIHLAQLNLTINSNTPDTNLSIYKVTTNWTGANITYNNQPNIDSDMLNNITSTENESADIFNITDIVREWHNGTQPKVGLSLRIFNESQNITSIKYYSIDSSNSTKWPVLFIIYNRTLPSQSIISGNNETNVFDLDNYFLEPDGQTMIYGVTSIANNTVNVTINANGTVDISTSSSYTGTATATFNATDGANTTISNQITITVTSSGTTTTTSDTGTSTSGGGGGGTRTKTAALSVELNKKRESIREGEILQVPVTLQNTGNVVLGGVTLSIRADKPGLVLRLTADNFGAMDINEIVQSTIIIDSSATTEESYVLTLDARSANPVLRESSSLVLDVLTESAKVKELLDFTVNFFNNNPECLELLELINKAEIQLQDKDYGSATSNLNIALEACKQILRTHEEPKLAKGRFSPLINTLLILTIATVIIIALYLGIKKILPVKKIKKKWF